MPTTKNFIRSFRFTCKVQDIALVQELLKAQKFIFEPDPYLPLTQHIIQEPFPLGRSLAAFWGLIYIQDRSSMLPALALNPSLEESILDMCASPGSKTSLLAQMVGNSGLIVSNEPSRTRLITLRQNLLNLNLFNTVTCSWSAEKLPMAAESWKAILLDPPCSGWGTSIKHPQTLKMWRGNRILPLIKLQKKLLSEATRLLQPGGKILYSTCTTNIDENEAQICFAQDILGLKILPLETFPGFSYTTPLMKKCEGTLRITKDNTSQGFYIACLQKPLTTKNETPTQSIIQNETTLLYKPIESTNFSINTQALPQGVFGVFGSAIHFLPQKALLSLPHDLYWQGSFFGKYTVNKKIILSPRLRLFDKKTNTIAKIHIEDSQTLEKIIQGQSLQTNFSGKEALLFWKELALGRVRLKNGRAFWSEK